MHRLADGQTIGELVADQSRLYKPVAPPPPSLEEARHAETLNVLHLLAGEVAGLVSLLAERPVPQVHVSPTDVHVPAVDLGPVAREIGSLRTAFDGISERIGAPDEVAPALSAVVDQLKSLSKKVTAMSVMPSGGSSDGATETTARQIQTRLDLLGEQATLAAVKTRADLLASEATLASLVAKDFATQTTLAAILAALTRTHKIAEGSAVITGVAGFVTVVTVTPSVASVVTGFNADVSALTDVPYRYQLTVGGVVKVSETITANRNSWVPVRLSVAANTAIAVQVDHSEVADQTFRASINYEET